MYVAVKGGERAIENAHQWLAEVRCGDPAVPELTTAQIRELLAKRASEERKALPSPETEKEEIDFFKEDDGFMEDGCP